MDITEKVEQYRKDRSALDSAVLRGEQDAPPCFTCKAPSTFVTDGITPAGYRAYQCDQHAPKRPAPLWGSDPGWQTQYITIEEARQREVARDQGAQP